MKELHVSTITEAIAEACKASCFDLPEDVESAIIASVSKEESPIGREILEQLIENSRIGREELIPICQDTGFTVVFVELGQDIHISGGWVVDAINEGVRRGYKEGFLRKSIVSHPLDRVNTGDNTPAVVHVDVVPGSQLRMVVVPKGGGCENMSALKMLKPSDGVDGVKKFVVDTVVSGGPNPCPPIIVGVGIGGTMDKAALLAKKAILRKIGMPSSNPRDAELEKELLELVNSSGIGPMGLGGRITALAVNVESFPAHIASLPVAVNIQCHSARQKEIIL